MRSFWIKLHEDFKRTFCVITVFPPGGADTQGDGIKVGLFLVQMTDQKSGFCSDFESFQIIRMINYSDSSSNSCF